MKTLLLVAFCLSLAAYVWLIVMLTPAPAHLLYAKPPEPQAPFSYFVRLMWKHELALTLTGGAVAAYAISLFRARRDWRPFAVLLIGVPLAFGIFDVFGV